jgi:hypothetical protein
MEGDQCDENHHPLITTAQDVINQLLQAPHEGDLAGSEVDLISNGKGQNIVQDSSTKLLELGIDIVREGVKNVSQHRHISLSQGQATAFSYIMTTFRILIFLILIIYLCKNNTLHRFSCDGD